MVLWEITLGTAYFLGLKRTYKLALKIQRRLISPKHPKTRLFVYRRTRAIFDMAVSVHTNIQKRDIEVGRNLGNWILRWLDKMKPSAEIRGGHPHSKSNTNTSVTKQVTNSSYQKTPGSHPTFSPKSGERESDRHLFTSSRSLWRKTYPTMPIMMTPFKPSGTITSYRFMSISPQALPSSYGRNGSGGIIRKDIMQWMVRN